MATTRELVWTVLALAAAPALAQSPPANPAPQASPAPAFTYQEVMIPMRDGARLQTVILTPAGAHGPLPILIQRTPYGVPDRAPPSIPPNFVELEKDGYILVIQARSRAVAT
ncbi:MAG TPA: CocE/NonD family hydrolase [Caulobacteraceae bacterium]